MEGADESTGLWRHHLTLLVFVTFSMFHYENLVLYLAKQIKVYSDELLAAAKMLCFSALLRIIFKLFATLPFIAGNSRFAA